MIETWGDFKAEVEKQGVTDDMEIDWIDWYGWGDIDVRLPIELNGLTIS